MDVPAHQIALLPENRTPQVPVTLPEKEKGKKGIACMYDIVAECFEFTVHVNGMESRDARIRLY